MKRKVVIISIILAFSAILYCTMMASRIKMFSLLENNQEELYISILNYRWKEDNKEYMIPAESTSYKQIIELAKSIDLYYFRHASNSKGYIRGDGEGLLTIRFGPKYENSLVFTEYTKYGFYLDSHSTREIWISEADNRILFQKIREILKNADEYMR